LLVPLFSEFPVCRTIGASAGLGELNQLVQAKIIGNNQISPATYEEGELVALAIFFGADPTQY
jgi:hypothetical protein